MASFFRTQLANIKTQLWLFLLFYFVPDFATDFEKATPYFFTPNPAFSQDYIHRIELTFFKSNWLHSTQLQLFQTMSFFSAAGSRRKQITTKSDAIRSGRNFAAFCKIYDAYYGQLDFLVMFNFYEIFPAQLLGLFTNTGTRSPLGNFPTLIVEIS